MALRNEEGRQQLGSVNSIPPKQQNFMKNGYDENNNYNKSDENKCATNYSIITNNNKWNVNTHINMQLTMHTTSTPMTTFTQTLAWCTSCAELAHSAHSSHCDDTAHLIGSSSEQTLCHPRSYPWCTLLDSTSPFCLYFSFLPFSVYFRHNEMFLELDNPIVMESLCYSAVEKSEGTLNASHSFTGTILHEEVC